MFYKSNYQLPNNATVAKVNLFLNPYLQYLYFLREIKCKVSAKYNTHNFRKISQRTMPRLMDTLKECFVPRCGISMQ